MAVLALVLAACGVPVPEDRPAPEPAEPQRPVVLARCEASDELGGSFNEWLPGDLRLALVIDLGSDELPAAIGALQRGIQEGRGGPWWGGGGGRWSRGSGWRRWACSSGCCGRS